MRRESWSACVALFVSATLIACGGSGRRADGPADAGGATDGLVASEDASGMAGRDGFVVGEAGGGDSLVVSRDASQNGDAADAAWGGPEVKDAADAAWGGPEVKAEADAREREADTEVPRLMDAGLDASIAIDAADAAENAVDGNVREDAGAPDLSSADAASAAATYWLSPLGSDSTGDGSAARPWRSINHAAAHADHGRGVPTINLAAGTYDEKVVLRDSLVLAGAGAGLVTIQNSAAGDTDYVITADGTAPSVAGVVTVTLSGLRVNGMAAKNRGILATQAVLVTHDVNVYQPSAYAISIGPNIAGFVVDRTTVGFVGMLYSDVGVDVGNGSSGTISQLVGGDHIDHIISIGLGCTVLIRDSTLTGSPIFYADGIRIQGASTVTVQNTTIVRPPGGEPASQGVHNPPYAGIEIAASSNGNALVTVDHVSTSGFDVGIGINLVYNRVLVHDSKVTGLSADVRTMWSGFMVDQYPVVDLGGGALASPGGNDFGTGSEPAIELGGPYGLSAKNNIWGTTAIETRIHDQLDDSKLGRVTY